MIYALSVGSITKIEILRLFFFTSTDIAHVHSKFFGPLPTGAEEFGSCIMEHFPHIIDTKVLLNSNDILQRQMKKSSTSLSSAFALLCPQIALGYKNRDLASTSRVKVEVQVDDIRSSCQTYLLI